MSKKFPKAIIVTALLVLTLVIASCGSAATVTQTGTVTTTVTSTPTPPGTTVQPPPAVKNPDTFVAVTIGDVDSLDPAYGYDTASGSQTQAIYDPLILFDGPSTTEFIPALATEWTVSPDGKTYRFKIREGVSFHNGNPLTPEDVEYSFERGMVQDYGAGPQWMFFEPFFGTDTHSSRLDEGLMPLEDITGTVEVDGQWVQFNLFSSYEPFLQILAGPWGSIVDQEWCIENGDWDGTQASYEALNDPASGGSPIQSIANGTGAFSLERWDEGIEISLLRNDDYWAGAPALERVITKVVEEWTTRKLMLEAGDADYAYVPRAFIIELEGVPDLTVLKDLPQLQNDAFFFQFAINPESTMIGSGALDGNGIPLDFFTDDDVRLGFTYAFDWETYLTDAMQNEAQQVTGPIVQGLSYYNQDNWPMYALDLEKAEEHLMAAWGGEVWEKGFAFNLAYNSGNVTRKTACEILQTNLLSINPEFKVAIQVMQWPTLLRGMYTGLLPMFQIGWAADYPDAHNFIFPYMHSGGTFSGWQNYNNPEADALVAQGISATTAAERQTIYDQLTNLYYTDAPGIMISQGLGRRYFRSWVQGYVFNPTNPCQWGRYADLSKEYIN
ncbi:MAG: ABC transporter substrate-binding protein [Anaerolineales bacterium]|nr:ABC transporter substrate-binding protein [Anaerolineales bacterium]